MPRAVKVPAGVDASGRDASLWGMTFDTAQGLLTEMERQSGRQWQMVGRGVKQRRAKCLSGAGAEPYRRPPVLSWACECEVYVEIKVSSPPGVCVSLNPVAVHGTSEVFCLPESNIHHCVTVTLAAEGSDTTRLSACMDRRTTPGVVAAAFNCVKVGTRLYVPTHTYNQTLTRIVPVMLVNDMDTGVWHEEAWCKGGPTVDCQLWAMGHYIYALGHTEPSPESKVARGYTCFRRYDTDQRRWTAIGLPTILGGVTRVRGTTNGQCIRHPFPDELSLRPSDQQCAVAVVTDTAYVFCCKATSIAVVTAYRHKSRPSGGWWKCRSHYARHTLFKTYICQMQRARGEKGLTLISAIVCGRRIVLVDKPPNARGRGTNQQSNITTYYAVFDTISEEWCEWDDLGIDNHVVQAEDGRIVYTQREKGREGPRLQVFSQAEVDPTLLYPHPDMRWAEY
ncbi:hypothetical protein KIPB_003257 [Kipferlia bialata]|uniref:Uncharacterized protein n=1 Tax=Kipferlia bialata TaxID=797122 RepID=A0A9K3GH28_9EUKA|nr:hypothetical protein KIPB_003257 [Kipferlia bialata]|eukprot:g3257.t1